MKTLYIDTSSSYLYTALIEDESILKEIKEEFGQNLSEVAMPKIASMFTDTNTSPKEIDKIVVVNGPGSFTGIRIGITIAKVYAWSLNIPITTVLSLEAMALSSKNKTYHVPIINARRGYVFGAIYDENNKEILKPQHITIKDLQEKLSQYQEYEIITNDTFEEFNNTYKYNPDILKIVKYCQNKKNISPHAVNPEYLKLTEAEENKQ